MRHPNPRILLYLALADAYCAATEYLQFPRDDEVRREALCFKKYLKHPTYTLGAGRYTDDTEMSIANTLVLLWCKPPYTPCMFADAYVKEFDRGGRRKGYSKSFQAFLERIQSGDEFLSSIEPRSTKNGAAMRAVPIGALREIEDVLKTAEIQARVTHDTPEGIFSAQAVALMSHFSLYADMPFSELKNYCIEHLPQKYLEKFGSIFHFRWPEIRVKEWPDTSVAIATVHAAFDLITRQNSLMDILKKVILWGGDTDSVAAISWGIASARYQREELPDFMERDIEGGNNLLGARRLSELGRQLMEKFA